MVGEKYVKIAGVKEIPTDAMRLFEAEGREILVVNTGDRFYAFENRCAHMGYPLYFGSLDGQVLTCGFHYAKFDIKTGESLGAVTKRHLRMFDVKIKDDDVLVRLW
jgi:nitrite reductase/ring-hydroxylating ferredoxin subunit